MAPTLVIQYSNEFERERVRSTLKKAVWYREHGYNVRLPVKRRLLKCDTLPSRDEINHALDAEYDEILYMKSEHTLSEEWRWFTQNWPQKEIEKSALQFHESYNVYLTQYGTGGSYNVPNTIITNINAQGSGRIGSIIFHEMIHLSIEPLIKKYKIPHWYKERIVDLTFKKLFPEIAFEQDLQKDAYVIDSIFEKYYGDMEKILQKVAQNKHESV